MTETRRRGLFTLMAAVIAAALVAAGITASGSGTSSSALSTDGQKPRQHSTDDESPRPQRAAVEAVERRLQRGGPIGAPHRDTQRAEMLGPNVTPFVSTTLLWPLRNGWQVSNHRRYTAVYAGGDGANSTDRSTGRLAIFRQNWIQHTQKTNLVDVADSGPLKITRAPLGKGRVQTRAQRRGKLRFTSKRGVRGVFHLRNDKAHLLP